MFERKILILVTATLLGFFILMQNRSFETVNDSIMRDNQSNVFQEIKILKDKNGELKEEIEELMAILESLDDQGSALDTIGNEIVKYEKLVGERPIFGAGILVSFNGNLTTPWVIDFINELWGAGAQAITINNIRLTNETVGFDTLPHGQILLHGEILSPPYVFTAIGDSGTMINILELPGGIFDRVEAAFPGIGISTEVKAVLQME